MRSLADLLPVLTPFAQSVPDPVAMFYLRQAAIDFCTRTRAWREIEEMEVESGEVEFMQNYAYASLHEIECVHFRDANTARWYKLEPKPYKDIDLNLLSDDQSNGARPFYFTQNAPGTLTILPKALGVVRVSMFLKPSPFTTSVPEWLTDKFPMALVDGALSYILMIPDQPYTNPSFGALKAQQFFAACDANAAYNIRGEQRAPARTKASWF